MDRRRFHPATPLDAATDPADNRGPSRPRTIRERSLHRRSARSSCNDRAPEPPPCAHRRGQALVEFALIVPLFILIVVGIFEGARAIYTYNALSNATDEALREAIVHQNPVAIRAEADRVLGGLALDTTAFTRRQLAARSPANTRASIASSFDHQFTPILIGADLQPDHRRGGEMPVEVIQAMITLLRRLTSGATRIARPARRNVARCWSSSASASRHGGHGGPRRSTSATPGDSSATRRTPPTRRQRRARRCSPRTCRSSPPIRRAGPNNNTHVPQP